MLPRLHDPTPTALPAGGSRRCVRRAMSFTYQIHREQRLAVAVSPAKLTSAEISAGMRQVFGDPAWQPGFDIIWDGRQIEQLLLTPEDIPEIMAVVEELSSRSGTGRSAVVVLRFMDYANARLFSARNRSPRGRNVRLFNTMAEAVTWLGVPPELVEADGSPGG